LLNEGDYTGPRVIGSRFSRDTFRIRDFLAKNRVHFTWVDLEGDPRVDRLLRQFRVGEADTPAPAEGIRAFALRRFDRPRHRPRRDAETPGRVGNGSALPGDGASHAFFLKSFISLHTSRGKPH
jgi:hypothetical protein